MCMSINNLGTFQTARSGLDYQAYSEILVFEVSFHTLLIIRLNYYRVTQSGQIEQSIILRVLDDDEPEILEYFTVELTNPSGGALLANNAVSIIMNRTAKKYSLTYIFDVSENF